MIKLNYQDSMRKAWQDALDELLKPEDYDIVAHLEQENQHWWAHQNQQEEDNG
jgi:hypothetical protein